MNPSGANSAPAPLHTIRATASQYPAWLAPVLSSGMSLKLVSSNDDRAVAIRDHLLHLVRDRGMLECQRDAVRLITLQLDPWLFKHWTPFNDPSPEQAASPGYRHALARQRLRPELPYGLEVWREDSKVLSVLWAEDGSFAVDSFVRGSWEDEALAL